MKKILHILFIFGILIIIVGWFFEHAQSFRWFMLKIAPEYVYSKDILDTLEQNEKIVITKEHPGFDYLLSKWPKLSARDQVEYIGRSIAYFEFGPKNKADIELIAYDSKEKEIKERWKYSEARSNIEKLRENMLFHYSGFIFFIGIIFTILSYILNEVIENKKIHNRSVRQSFRA